MLKITFFRVQNIDSQRTPKNYFTTRFFFCFFRVQKTFEDTVSEADHIAGHIVTLVRQKPSADVFGGYACIEANMLPTYLNMSAENVVIMSRLHTASSFV